MGTGAEVGPREVQEAQGGERGGARHQGGKRGGPQGGRSKEGPGAGSAQGPLCQNLTSVCLIIGAVIGLFRCCFSFLTAVTGLFVHCHWFLRLLGIMLLRTSLACHGEVYRDLKVALSVREQYVQLLGHCSVSKFCSEKQLENTLASVSMLRPL